MKRSAFLSVLLTLMLLRIVLPRLLPEQHLAGEIIIYAADIRAEVMTASHGPDCGCCGMLWQGGIVTTTADLSAVQLYDMACLITVDEDSMAMECVEITPCLRLGSTLIGWRGILRAEGDVLVFSGGRAYRFIKL